VGRYRDALLGDRAEALAILYGYNDGRYTGAPATLNAQAFRRDYAEMLVGLLEGGFTAGSIVIGSPPCPSERGLGVGSAGFTGQTRIGFERYVEAARSLAAEFGVYYAPVYEVMRDYREGVLMSDDVTHPNDAGHAVIGTAFRLAMRA
jgi:lysophospholipase L1-like esterase